MQIVLNGEPYELESGRTVADLIDRLGLGGRLAVEINGEILPRSELARRRLKPQDRVEIVRAIGGG